MEGYRDPAVREQLISKRYPQVAQARRGARHETCRSTPYSPTDSTRTTRYTPVPAVAGGKTGDAGGGPTAPGPCAAASACPQEPEQQQELTAPTSAMEHAAAAPARRRRSASARTELVARWRRLGAGISTTSLGGAGSRLR